MTSKFEIYLCYVPLSIIPVLLTMYVRAGNYSKQNEIHLETSQFYRTILFQTALVQD